MSYILEVDVTQPKVIKSIFLLHYNHFSQPIFHLLYTWFSALYSNHASTTIITIDHIVYIYLHSAVYFKSIYDYIDCSNNIVSKL